MAYKLKSSLPFLIKVSALALVWIVFSFNPFNAFSLVNSLVLDVLQNISLAFLKSLGYEIFSNRRIFGIMGSPGVEMGIPCNGLTLMYVYSSFFIAIQGAWARKVVWITLGMIVIQLLNLLRIVTLIFMSAYKREWLNFNHDYTFTFLLYLMIFIAWIIYSRKEHHEV